MIRFRITLTLTINQLINPMTHVNVILLNFSLVKITFLSHERKFLTSTFAWYIFLSMIFLREEYEKLYINNSMPKSRMYLYLRFDLNWGVFNFFGIIYMLDVINCLKIFRNCSNWSSLSFNYSLTHNYSCSLYIPNTIYSYTNHLCAALNHGIVTLWCVTQINIYPFLHLYMLLNAISEQLLAILY